ALPHSLQGQGQPVLGAGLNRSELGGCCLSISSSPNWGVASTDVCCPQSGSRNGIYGTWTGARPYSALMLAARITLAHFSVSSAMSLPNSAGELATTPPPRSANRALVLGSVRPALMSLLSLSTISAGVFRGAQMPNQAVDS